jgi:hypothetical protein
MRVEASSMTAEISTLTSELASLATAESSMTAEIPTLANELSMTMQGSSPGGAVPMVEASTLLTAHAAPEADSIMHHLFCGWYEGGSDYKEVDVENKLELPTGPPVPADGHIERYLLVPSSLASVPHAQSLTPPWPDPRDEITSRSRSPSSRLGLPTPHYHFVSPPRRRVTLQAVGGELPPSPSPSGEAMQENAFDIFDDVHHTPEGREEEPTLQSNEAMEANSTSVKQGKENSQFCAKFILGQSAPRSLLLETQMGPLQQCAAHYFGASSVAHAHTDGIPSRPAPIVVATRQRDNLAFVLTGSKEFYRASPPSFLRVRGQGKEHERLTVNPFDEAVHVDGGSAFGLDKPIRPRGRGDYVPELSFADFEPLFAASAPSTARSSESPRDPEISVATTAAAAAPVPGEIDADVATPACVAAPTPREMSVRSEMKESEAYVSAQIRRVEAAQRESATTVQALQDSLKITARQMSDDIRTCVAEAMSGVENRLSYSLTASVDSMERRLEALLQHGISKQPEDVGSAPEDTSTPGAGRGRGRSSHTGTSPHGYQVRFASHSRNRPLDSAASGGNPRSSYTNAHARYSVSMGSREGCFVSVVLVAAVYANSIPVRTVILSQPTLSSWLLPRRAHDTYTAWEAFAALPLVPLQPEDPGVRVARPYALVQPAMDEIAEQLHRRLECRYLREVSVQVPSLFSAPIAVDEGQSCGMVRVDAVFEEGVDLEEVLDALNNYSDMDNVLTTQSTDRLSEVYALHRACTNAMALRPPPQGALVEIVTTFLRVATYAPSVADAAGPSPSVSGDGFSRPSYAEGDQSKRVSWSKDPVTDISELIPEYEGSMRKYHWGGLQTLHSAHRSRIQLLLKEVRPYATFMAALLAKHLAANPLVAAQMADQTTMDSLANAHRLTLAEYGDAIENARNDPSRNNLHDVYDLFATGALNVRAAANGTSAMGELQSDADALSQFVAKTPIDSHLDYACHVADAFTKVRQMLGDRMSHKMMTMGMISQLLPTFVSRLSPYLRDKALEYWNSVARELRYDGPLRQHLPATLRDRVDSHLSLHREVNATAPAMMDLGRVMSLDVAEVGRLTRVMESEFNGSTVRIVHVPADLYWIAPTSILLSHWNSFMRHLLGSHVKSMRPAPSGIFELSTGAEFGSSPYSLPGAELLSDFVNVGNA